MIYPALCLAPFGVSQRRCFMEGVAAEAGAVSTLWSRRGPSPSAVCPAVPCLPKRAGSAPSRGPDPASPLLSGGSVCTEGKVSEQPWLKRHGSLKKKIKFIFRPDHLFQRSWNFKRACLSAMPCILPGPFSTSVSLWSVLSFHFTLLRPRPRVLLALPSLCSWIKGTLYVLTLAPDCHFGK